MNACKCVDLGAYAIICECMSELVCVIEVGSAAVHVFVFVLLLEYFFMYVAEAYFIVIVMSACMLVSVCMHSDVGILMDECWCIYVVIVFLACS